MTEEKHISKPSDQSQKPKFPDLERERVKEQIASKQWGNCPECDWWYKFTALDRCPMCRHPWKAGKTYKQPPYESSSLTT